MSSTIAIYNFKGGVGKTTTTLNLGYAWSKSFKVLLIDCDPQCNLTSAFGGPENPNTIYKYLKGLVHDQAPDKLRPTEITPYLHLIPGDYLMSEIESNSQFISFGPHILQKFQYLIKKEYDLILLDLPTNFGMLVKSILANADSILIPSIPDSFSISGVKKLLTYLYTIERSRPLNILGVCFNMFKENLIHHREKFQESVDEFGELILQTRVSNSIKITEATDLGKSAYGIDPDNHTAREFIDLSDELISKFNNTFLNGSLISEEFLVRLKGA